MRLPLGIRGHGWGIPFSSGSTTYIVVVCRDRVLAVSRRNSISINLLPNIQPPWRFGHGEPVVTVQPFERCRALTRSRQVRTLVSQVDLIKYLVLMRGPAGFHLPRSGAVHSQSALKYSIVRSDHSKHNNTCWFNPIVHRDPSEGDQVHPGNTCRHPNPKHRLP